MHELKAATDILNIALEACEKEGEDAYITDIFLVIGELSSYLDDSLGMYFAEIARDTKAENAKLHFKRIPARFFCEKCNRHYDKRGSNFSCNTCGEIGKLDRTSAKEFYVEEVRTVVKGHL